MGYTLLTTGREFYRLWLRVAKSELAILIQDPKTSKVWLKPWPVTKPAYRTTIACKIGFLWNVAPLLPNSALGARPAKNSKALYKAAMSKSALSGLTLRKFTIQSVLARHRYRGGRSAIVVVQSLVKLGLLKHTLNFLPQLY